MPMEITMMMITMIHICSKPLVEIKYFKLMMTMIHFFSNIHDDDDVNANLHLAGDDLNAATQPAPLFIRETSANGSGPERENPQGLPLTFYLDKTK